MPAYLDPLGKGRPVLLDKPILFVGRHPECDIVLLNSRKVSRKHCCMAQINDGFKVRDLGSTNGVSVNGKRIKKESKITIGDQVMFGDVAYNLLSGTAPKNAKPASQKSPTADDDSVGDEEEIEQLVAEAQAIDDSADLDGEIVAAPASVELSQEFPVVIDDDEPISISKLPPSEKPAPPADLRNSTEDSSFDEDSSADIVLLDESHQFLDDDEDDDD